MVTIATTMEKEGLKLHTKLTNMTGNKKAQNLTVELEESGAHVLVACFDTRCSFLIQYGRT
jgi:hypothetical protein